MKPKPILTRRRIGTALLATTLSVFVTVGLIGAVVGVFQRDGVLFEEVVMAEHACADRAFVADREACVRLRIARSRIRGAASR